MSRKKTGQIPVRSFRISKEDYLAFCKWARDRGFSVSEALRGLIKFVELKGDEEE